MRLRYAGGDHRRGLHGGRLSTRRGTERVEKDNGYCGCCPLETPAYNGPANLDFHNVSFQSYVNTARQSYADSSCGSMALTVPEPMNLDTIAKLREELHAYIGERRNDRFSRQVGRETRRCYNCGEQGHLPRNCLNYQPPCGGRERRESRSGTPRRDLSRDSKGRFGSRFKSRDRSRTA